MKCVQENPFGRSREPRRLAALVFAAVMIPTTAGADGSFAVMSYNVKGLPEIPFVIPNRTDQMHDIAERLEDFHTEEGPYVGMPSIVGLQEVFANDYYKILTDPETVSYVYITPRDRRGDFNTGDGLTILSDFYFEDLSRTKWNMCNGSLTEDGSDCDTPKGFTFAEVTLEQGVTFHLYTLHADAGQTLEDREARRSNINQLIDAINLESPEGTAVIVLGDTNSRYTRADADNIDDLLTETGVRDVWVDLRRGGVPPGPGSPITEDCDTTPSTGNCEQVDKIFYRDGDRLDFDPQTYQVLREMFMGTQKPLSDHDPVVVEFAYAIVTPTIGDRPCGDPVAESEGVAAGDALVVLKSAVGSVACPPCTCDVDSSGSVSAIDALFVLKVAVGQTATLDCPPCEGSSTTTTIETTTTTLETITTTSSTLTTTTSEPTTTTLP